MKLSGSVGEKKMSENKLKLKLVKENDPILTEMTEEWDFEKDGDPNELVKEMTRLMFLHGGIGLSANQCGVNKRVFIMGNEEELVACINPKIVSLSDQRILGEEGCLSFPGLWLKVKRPASAVVSYQTIAGVEKQEEMFGFKARVFLHEFDHLMGIAFTERVSDYSLKIAKERRIKYLKKLKKASLPK